MCGICGFVGKKTGDWDREQVLEEMKDAIRHRGPDDGGSWLSADAALGFRRLPLEPAPLPIPAEASSSGQKPPGRPGTLWPKPSSPLLEQS